MLMLPRAVLLIPGAKMIDFGRALEPHLFDVDMLHAENHPDSAKTSYTDRIILGCSGKL